MWIDREGLRAERDRGHGGFVSSSAHEDSHESSGLTFPDAFSELLAAGIGRRARLARRARRMNQADVAERLGVTTEFYARIERGNALPSVTTLARLVAVLDLELDPIFERASGDALAGAGPPSDPPAVRRVLRRLRRAPPSAWRLVIELLEALDTASGRDPAASPGDPGALGPCSPEDRP